MADARPFTVVDSTGAPLTGGVAGMTVLLAFTVVGGGVAAPAITELGGGLYEIRPTDADEAAGTVVHIDCGAGRTPRRVTVAIYKADNSNQFWAWHNEDSAGDYWSGSAPTWGAYYGATGTSRTPPTINTITDTGVLQLVSFATPTAADVLADVAGRVDLGGTPWVQVDSEPTFVAATPVPVAPVQPASTYQQAQQGVPTPITWKDYQEETAPPWLRAGSGRAWLRALGDMKDKAEERLKDAVKARLPDLAPADAVARIASERQLVTGPSESSTSFRARLKAAWDAWPYAGTPLGLLRAYYYAGYSNVALLTQMGQTHTLDGSLNLVTVSGVDHEIGPFWNTYRIVFFSPLPSSWSPTPPGNTSDEVSLLRTIARRWQAGHANLDAILAVNGPVWGYPASQTWGAAGNWGSTATIWTP